MNHHPAIAPRRPTLSALLALLLLPALPASPSAPFSLSPALPAAAADAASPSPVIFSLSADSAVSDKARKTWDYWTRAHFDPAIAAEFAEEKDNSDSSTPSHFIRPTPYLALRLSPDPYRPAPAASGLLSCRFDLYAAPTNQLPGLDPDAPVFADRAPLYTETVTLPSGLPATVPLPTTLSDGGTLDTVTPRTFYHSLLVVRATLQTAATPGADPVPLAATVLPPFGPHSGRAASILASTNLPPDIWQSANDSWAPWTPSAYPDTIPDFLPARTPHTVVLSPEDLAAMADRPVLARRLALSGTDVHAPGTKSPILPVQPPISSNSVLFRYNSVLFRNPSPSAKGVTPPSQHAINHDDPLTILAPPAEVRGTFPVYSAWIAIPFLLTAAVTVLLLVVVFRRTPSLRTSLWILFPAVALAAALLILLAGRLLVPRTPVADRILFRVGYDGSPEEWCRYSTRCFSFRPADWTFAYPSADAGVTAYGDGSPHLPYHLFRLAERDTTLLTFPRGIPSTAFTVEATWFAPSDFPLQVRPPADPVPDDAPETLSREITVTRDLADLWVVISTNHYHIGPVAAGTTLHPRPVNLLTNNFPYPPPPFTDRLSYPRGNCGCPDPDPPSSDAAPVEIIDLGAPDSPSADALSKPPLDPSADAWRWATRTPWVTIARADGIDSAGPSLSPETRSTAQTLWITEWP